MKKLLAVAAIVGTVSTLSLDAHAVSGEFQVGTEYEDYNGAYNSEDFILPFVYGKLYPMEESPFFVEAKYSYRKKDDDDAYRKDRRRRYEFYTGYAWKWDRFAFTPKAGIRFEEYSDTATNDTVSKWRFYPNMSYKLNDKTSLFLSGFVSYVDIEKNDKQDVDGYQVDGYQVDGYNHELESGVKYKLPNTQELQVSLYSEYTRDKDESSTEEYQLRLRYNHKLENGKTTLSPWVRIGLDREQRDKNGQGDKDRLRHRIGLTASHNVTDDFSVFGEINWQTEKVEDYSNATNKSSKADKNRTFYKIGFKQKF